MADSNAKMVLVRTIMATLTTSDLVRIKVCTANGNATLRFRDLHGNVLANPTILPDPGYNPVTWVAVLTEALKHLSTESFNYFFLVTDYDCANEELFGWKADKVDGASNIYCHL